MQQIKEQKDKYLLEISNYINDFFDKSVNIPENLLTAMKYSVINGGKRVRPLLCLATANMLGQNEKSVINYAVAIEFIHSYSLVHDDLPCMDNDDYRRGQLSTHKKFGEAIGVLTGDALLNSAIEIALNKENQNSNDFEALSLLFNYAGANGMIAGQIYDLEYENSLVKTEEILFKISENKTAKLIQAPILVASIIANKKYFNELKEYAYNLGVLFQITDDIFDEVGTLETIGKTPKKDEKSDKLTAISIFGLNGAKEKAKEIYQKCMQILLKIENSEFLQNFTKQLYERNN